MLQNILQAKNMAKFVSIFCSEGPFLWHKNGSNAGVHSMRFEVLLAVQYSQVIRIFDIFTSFYKMLSNQVS